MYVIETYWTKIGLKLKLKSDWKGKEENFEFYSAYLEYNKNMCQKRSRLFHLLLKNDKLNGEIKLKTENVQSNPSLRLKRIS